MTQIVSAPQQESASALVAREIRAELGRQQVSNRRLAERLGVSYMWVSRRLTMGDVALTIDEAQRIAVELGVPVQQLLAPWLENSASPNRAVIGAYPGESNTQSYDNVLDFPVTLARLGDEPGAMRATRTVAA